MTKKVFEPDKKYRFNRDLYLTHPGNSLRYKANSVNRFLIDRLDGQEVTVTSELIGIIILSGRKYYVFPQWCEVEGGEQVQIDYKKCMVIRLDRIEGPLLFRFTGTVQQLRDYLAWCKEQKKRLNK